MLLCALATVAMATRGHWETASWAPWSELPEQDLASIRVGLGGSKERNYRYLGANSLFRASSKVLCLSFPI